MLKPKTVTTVGIKCQKKEVVSPMSRAKKLDTKFLQPGRFFQLVHLFQNKA